MLGQNRKEDIVKDDTHKDDIVNELYLKGPDDIQKTLEDGFGLEEESEEPIDDIEERERKQASECYHSFHGDSSI